MMRRLPGVTLLVFVLCWGLSGCAGTKPMLSEAEQKRNPNSATIYLHRKNSITGGFSADYWIDWGEGARWNAMIYDFHTNAFPKRELSPTMERLSLTLEDLVPIKRADVRNPIVVDFLLVKTAPGEEECLRYGRLHNFSPQIGLPMPEWQPNASVVGKVGPGATLTWNRPAGTIDLDFMRASELVRTPVRLAVEAGKTYHIEYTMGLKFMVREGSGATKELP
jgi:hypothetical protein